MTIFLAFVSRIANELQRTTLIGDIKDAANAAIKEAAQTRFYFNEMRGLTFDTVADTEYYADQNLTEVDSLFITVGATRYNLYPDTNFQADNRADGNIVRGRPDRFARSGMFLRLWPVPDAVYAVTMEGFGRLTPWPLVADTAENAWLTEGEQYIRALTKRNFLRDRVRDYKEAAIFDATAEDYKDQLLAETSQRFSTGRMRSTCW